MTPMKRLEQVTREVKKAAAKHNYKQGSHAYASYVRGAFLVAVDAHPELSSLKPTYLRLMGVLA